MTERRLEAPHRRLERGPRVLEIAAVTGYRTVAWLLGHLPNGPARVVIGRFAQLGYLVWPAKRTWSNRNFGYVLGLPPDHPRVRRLALAAYYEYGRYLVEVMRLPYEDMESMVRRVPSDELEGIGDIWRSSPGGLIFAIAHVGNNEAVAAGVAAKGWPINVVADDSSFPELFEIMRDLREGWGVHVIPWRNLREVYTVLRRKEMLALLVDWGYRADGIPVRLFGAWTTLPAGPAAMAAKTNSVILPITIRRDGRNFHVSWAPPISVASSAPADLQRATQAVADAIAGSIGAAPEQWYSFKPIWPATAAEASELEQRALAMLASDGRPKAGDDRPRAGDGLTEPSDVEAAAS